jgi:hypothetical protein
MGGVFGVVQLIVWIWYDNPWLLPAFGFVVGVLTNWLALKMIFQPVQPHYPCGARGWRIQGLFLQRQREVSAVYARTITKKVLNSKNILASLIAGPLTDRLFALVHAHVKTVVDEYAGVSRAVLNVTVGGQLYARIKEDVCERFLEKLPSLLQSLEAYTDRALDMESTIKEKMENLPPEEFEGLLHPVFQEDEWKLVLVREMQGNYTAERANGTIIPAQRCQDAVSSCLHFLLAYCVLCCVARRWAACWVSSSVSRRFTFWAREESWPAARLVSGASVLDSLLPDRQPTSTFFELFSSVGTVGNCMRLRS